MCPQKQRHIGIAVDEPDIYFHQIYVSASKRNYPGYDDPEFDKLVDQQSQELDPVKRKQLVQDTHYRLQKDLGRPIIYHLRAAICWQPHSRVSP